MYSHTNLSKELSSEPIPRFLRFTKHNFLILKNVPFENGLSKARSKTTCPATMVNKNTHTHHKCFFILTYLICNPTS